MQAEPDVELIFVQEGEAIPGDADLIILPGSKTTIPDLKNLREQGWDIDIQAHLRRGGHVLGICAGYQMLGMKLNDPDGIEGESGAVSGLGLLQIETNMSGTKKLVEVQGKEFSTEKAISGYEMHMGRSQGQGLLYPMLHLDGHDDGAVSSDGRVMGCYLHGLFSNDDFRAAYLKRFNVDRETSVAYEALVEETLDQLADHCEKYLDIDAMISIAKTGV